MTNEFNTGVIKPVECFKEGWEMIKDQYWLFFGITVVGMLIAGFIPFGIGIGALYCGIYLCLLRRMNGEPVEFADLFKGFNYFVPGLIATLVLIIPMIFSLIFCYVSMFAAAFAIFSSNHGRPDESAIFALYGVVMVEGVIIAVILSCIHAFIMFTFPLIVERNLSGFDAVKLSARAAWKNLGGVVGLILCEFAIGFVGYLVCAVGVYFTLPIMFAGCAVAYRKVFPRLS